jgi:hypothetical protein
MEQDTHRETQDDRREFLKKCGQFAVVTPPAVTFLLSTSMSSQAIASSGGRPARGFGSKKHGHSGARGHGGGPGKNKLAKTRKAKARAGKKK